MNPLDQTLRDVAERIARFRGSRRLDEQNTKATLIEPVLRALGWNPEDLDEVHREYKPQRRDKPVDYALLDLGSPRLFVEAKGLGENLDDRRWAGQIMGYAGVAGVEWVLLTDGDQYRLYNAHAAVGVEEKLFRKVRVSEDASAALDTLRLLSKERMKENDLSVLWRAEFVDRQVGAAVKDLFSPESDAVVKLIHKLAPSLAAKEIRASLARMRLSMEFPLDAALTAAATQAVELEASIAPAGKRTRAKATKAGSAPSYERVDPQAASVTVQDLIRAGLMRTPFKLVVRYRGRDLEAVIQKDGTVACLGQSFASLSTAGAAARASVIGPRPDGSHPATNGWLFWKCTMPDGSRKPVGELRDLFLAQQRGEGGPPLRIVKGGA